MKCPVLEGLRRCQLLQGFIVQPRTVFPKVKGGALLGDPLERKGPRDISVGTNTSFRVRIPKTNPLEKLRVNIQKCHSFQQKWPPNNVVCLLNIQ